MKTKTHLDPSASADSVWVARTWNITVPQPALVLRRLTIRGR